jgi:Tol biopolymer transport system component
MTRSALACAAFVSACGALVPAQSTARVSTDSSGAQGNNYSGTYGNAISGDGRWVAFGSGATNLVPGGSPLQWELFRKDRRTGITAIVSVDSLGSPGGAGSFYPSLSADGNLVAFESDSGFGTGDTNGRRDVFVHDCTAGSTELVSVGPTGTQWGDACSGAAISGNGNVVAFVKTHLVAGSGRDGGGYHARIDVLVRDRAAGTTVFANLNPAGVVSNTVNGLSPAPSISFDGRFVAFASAATDLVAGDTNGHYDVFVRDLAFGVTTRASLDGNGVEGDGDSLSPSISADGRYVAFTSAATDLVPGDANGHTDVFVRDRVAGTTVLASVSTLGAQADADCLAPRISADGRCVVFHSVATTLAPANGDLYDDVFVRDLEHGTTERVSVALAGDPNGASDMPSISGDGRCVAFRSMASNLVAGDTNGTFDVFVRDRGLTGSIAALPGAGCPGSAGTPLHTATGTPEIGGSVQYALASAPGNAPAAAIFGLSDTYWDAVPLPFDFAAIGAPGCLLRVAPTVLDFGLTQPDGTLVQTLAFAHEPALLGAALFSQFAAVDPEANALGVTLSNAVATTLGGY